jgi:hypothetical protein
MFSRYDDVLVCPEADILIEKFLINPAGLFKYNDAEKENIEIIRREDKKFRLWNITESDLEVLYNSNVNFEAFLNILLIYRQKVKPSANTIIFKGDILIRKFKEITKFPLDNLNIQFISIYRDVRAVYNSQKKTVGSGNRCLSYNPVRTSSEWIKFIKLSDAYLNDDKFNIIRYEDLINNFSDTFMNLLKKLNLDFNNINTSGDLYERIPDNLKSMHIKINELPDLSRIDAWDQELSKTEIYIIENFTKKILLEKGYRLKKMKLNYLTFLILLMYYYSDFILNGIYKKLINLFKN